MKQILWAAVSAYAIFLPSQTLAGDLSELPYDWTGFYLGSQVGFSSGAMSTSGADDVEDCYCLSPRGDIAQVLAGGRVGYNRQISNIVIGVEGDVSLKFGREFFPRQNSAHAPLLMAACARALAT